MSGKQVLMREVNDRIRELNAGFRITSGSCVVLCECGASDCFEQIVAPIEVLRRDADQLLIAPGHESVAVAVAA